MGNKIVFRCDANKENGYGHFSRCLNIARAIKAEGISSAIIFFGDFETPATALLKKYSIEIVSYNLYADESLVEMLGFIEDASVVVLDSYKINQDYINKLSGRNFQLVIIDDFNKYDLSKTNLVLNFCIGANKLTYNAPEQLLGIEYLPFKPELEAVRMTKVSENTTGYKNILVIIGGVDIYSIAEKLVQDIDKTVSGKNIVLLSNTVKQIEGITSNSFSIKPFSDKMEDLYSWADVTVTGGGLVKYESAFCCIPNANLPQSEGELKDSVELEAAGLTYTICNAYEYNSDLVQKKLRMFFTNDVLSKTKNGCRNKFTTSSLKNIALKITA